MTSSATPTDCQSCQTNTTYLIWRLSLQKCSALSVRPHWRFLTRQHGTRPSRASLSRGTRPCLLISGLFITTLIVGRIHPVSGQSGSWTSKGVFVWRGSCHSQQEYGRALEKSLPEMLFSCTLRDCCTALNLSARMIKYYLMLKTVIMGSCLIASLLRSVLSKEQVAIVETEKGWTNPSVRTQTYFRLSLLSGGVESDSWK